MQSCPAVQIVLTWLNLHLGTFKHRRMTIIHSRGHNSSPHTYIPALWDTEQDYHKFASLDKFSRSSLKVQYKKKTGHVVQCEGLGSVHSADKRINAHQPLKEARWAVPWLTDEEN